MQHWYPLRQTSRNTAEKKVSSAALALAGGKGRKYHILQGRELSNAKCGNDYSQPALDSRVPIGSIGSIELIGISDPFNIGVLLNVVELPCQSYLLA